MDHCTGSTKQFHRRFTRGGTTLPLEGSRVKDLHRREANWLIVGVMATDQIGAPLVLDKGMTISWLRLIARGGCSSVGGSHDMVSCREEQRHSNTSLDCCTLKRWHPIHDKDR